MSDRSDCALLQEVVDILDEHALTRCAVTTEWDRDELRIQIRVPRASGLNVVELGNQMSYLAGLSQVRAFAAQYGIDSVALERLLPPKEGL
jgi:hypothetical protein